MPLKLSCYQVKTVLSFLKILCKPCGNHKEMTYSDYTKERDKEVKAYWYQKESKHTKTSRIQNKNNVSIKHPEDN